MEDLFSVLSSPSFRRVMISLGFLAIFLAIATTVVAFAWYRRARDVRGDTPEDQRWSLLFGTWRDSLIITILFTAQGFLYRYSEFQTAAEHFPTTVLLFAPIAVPVLSFVLDLLIFVVAILRVITISSWMSRDA